MNQRLDAETKKVLEEGNAYDQLVKSEGWQMAKTDLIHLLTAVTDLNSIDLASYKDVGQLEREIAARQMASLKVIEWIREVEGKAEQYRNNKGTVAEMREEYLLTVE